MTAKGATLLLALTLALEGCRCDTRYFLKMRTNASELFKTKADGLRVLQEPVAITRSPLYDERKGDFQNDDNAPIRDTHFDKKNSQETSTFNPDVLNKFLEEYANKIKGTTEKNFKYPFRVVKPTPEALVLEIDDHEEATRDPGEQEKEKLHVESNSTLAEEGLSEVLNDTLKRNKYYGMNSHDDRNGWVTLEAIPWSKSKISKWQANPTTQRPWPELKPWEKPSISKPWPSDYSSRPAYESNKPWYEKPKPNWAENEKPWQKPTSRPTYYPDKYEDLSSQSQKWPPERPTWDKYTQHPNSDIITDDRPSNFPNNWNRPSSKPSYQFVDRYQDKEQDKNDWHEFPSRYDQHKDRPRPAAVTERPNFSQYQYVNTHPPSHPANGDGQWVLLSTNRGYSKSRQRSIKIDAMNPDGRSNSTKTKNGKKQDQEAPVPVMTSKRQVRLTVLPSINGTNTTTSHGGLLEVERTFKSVEQSKKEYEQERQTTLPTILRRRPTRNTLNGQPSSSAVLAAVGAGMLPATMAMMIPMMLGRRKRESYPMENIPNRSNDFRGDLRESISIHDLRRRRFLRL